MKILICGLGSIGQRHARNLISLGYEDLYALRTRKWQLPKELEKIHQVEDIGKALKLKPDVVLITNPTSLHLKFALEFAKIGSHLFIEKPLSNTLASVDELEEIVGKNKSIAMIGYNFRFHPQLIQIKKILDEKTIGKIITVSTMTGEHLPNWHPTEDYRQGYSARADLGGGVILTQSHDLDYLYWLIGDYAQIYAQAGKKSNLEIDVEDTVQMLVKFKNSAFGSLHLDYLQNPPIRQITVVGTKGKVFWDYYKNYFEVVQNGKTKKFEKPKKFERNDMYIAEIKYFLECVENKKQSQITLSQGKRILEVCLAAKQSARIDKKVVL